MSPFFVNYCFDTRFSIDLVSTRHDENQHERTVAQHYGTFTTPPETTLQLPEMMKIYPVFHFSILEQAAENSIKGQVIPPPPPPH